MSALWMYSAGPELYYRYKHGSTPGAAYVENKVETYSSRTINCLRASWNVCLYLSPMIMLILYRRGSFTTPDGPPYLAKVVSAAMGVYCFAQLTRGIGRMSNTAYKTFAADLRLVQNGIASNSLIARYDFTFTHWPVRYSVKGKSAPAVATKKTDNKLSAGDKLNELPARVISYVAASSFARWLIYPGSTSLLNAMIGPALVEGRTKLIQTHGGQRNKLETYEGNCIDTIFIDRRHEGTDNGNILVITSEGNAAFYEAGCIDAPLTRGYSILGWNHPGFGSSTGTPNPDQVHNAIDTVIQFALNELDFPVEQIVFFSWSIGGFAATWAAAHYPECKALILDATFDDIHLLAKNRMPRWMGKMVDFTINDYFNLDNASWLNRYNGPVRLIRRTQDEMISVDPVDVRTNRGNFLLLKLLMYRYPHIMNADARAVVTRWLGFTEERKDEYFIQQSVDRESCNSQLLKLAEQSDHTIPMLAGESLTQEAKNQIALYLADKYMSDLVTTHCTPLPPDMFELPWQLESL